MITQLKGTLKLFSFLIWVAVGLVVFFWLALLLLLGHYSTLMTACVPALIWCAISAFMLNRAYPERG